MPKMHIERAININAQAEDVFKVLNNFEEWAIWSPWLIMDPKAKIKVHDDKQSYEWNGQRVGAGNMKIIDQELNKAVTYELEFIKPWKSKANVRFELSDTIGSTLVTWSMESSLPFFMFFMKKLMEAMVGNDYERGLSMLKAYIETGEVPSRLEFKGTSFFDGCHYIGIKRDCTKDEIGQSMKKDFDTLAAFAEENKANISGPGFSIYHKWDLVKGDVTYTAGFPIKNKTQSLPPELIEGRIPATNIYTLRHTGPYEHLGNAWSTLYAMDRNKEIVCQKDIHPFEFYVNNPMDVSENELITDVHFALK